MRLRAAAVQPTQTIKIPQVICGVDLLMAFLKQDPVEEPMQWLKAVCNEQSANFPVHYFLSQAKASVAEAIAEVEDVITREVGKARLLKALREGRRQPALRFCLRNSGRNADASLWKPSARSRLTRRLRREVHSRGSPAANCGLAGACGGGSNGYRDDSRAIGRCEP
jgi:hypothetical protein